MAVWGVAKDGRFPCHGVYQTTLTKEPPLSTLATPLPADQRSPRFRPLPWHDLHPDWRALDLLLPPHHLVRRIDHAVSLLDRSSLDRLYHGRGELAFDPAFLLRAVLYFTQCGILSPAEWHEAAQFDGRVRWLLRGAQPARSAWYDFRKRLTTGLEDMNQALVLLAIAVGLTAAQEGALDGTSVAAHGSRHRLLNAVGLQKRLDILAVALAADTPQTGTPPLPAALLPAATPGLAGTATPLVATPSPAGTPPASTATPSVATPTPPAWLAATAAGRQQQHSDLLAAQDELNRRRAHNAQRPSGKRLADKNVRVCPSEPGAALGRDKEKIFRPFYNVQLVADLHSPLILGYAVLTQPNDAGTLGPLLTDLHAQRIPLQVVAVDSGYTSGADLAAAEAAGVTVYGSPAGVAGPTTRRRPPKYLPKSSFRWDA
jgi:transposase